MEAQVVAGQILIFQFFLLLKGSLSSALIGRLSLKVNAHTGEISQDKVIYH